jgi:hypothetical protein
MWLVQLLFMFLVITGLISIDRSLKQKLKNDQKIIDQLEYLSKVHNLNDIDRQKL